MKPTVAIIFGGPSAEHEVSLQSATNIYQAIDTGRFTPLLLGIDKNGDWRYRAGYDQQPVNLAERDYFSEAEKVRLLREEGRAALVRSSNSEVLAAFDIAFPIIHGTFGEDGTLQAILKSLHIPFAGPDVLGSAIGMDKDAAKRLLRDAGIAVAAFYTLRKNNPHEFTYEEITGRLGLPLFVKPANAGSSVGVSKVTSKEEYLKALDIAFDYDYKILVEEAVNGKEVECAVLGNEHVRASVVGEIVPTKDFYSYEAKYLNDDGAKMKIPADADPSVAEAIRATAVKAFGVLCCEGMARVDFFLKPDHTFVLNEINTLPGFTKISMYPKLWEAAGLSYNELITELLELAVQRQRRNEALSKVRA